MKIALLGSTGSIGVNTLKVAQDFGIDVEVLVAGNNIELLKKQIDTFHPKIVVSASKVDGISAKHYFWGEEGILEALEMSESKVVVNALVGFLGLKPTLKALALGKEVALANKESLVVAGKFIDKSKIAPIDSEHFGLWYLLQNRFKPQKLIITASGGAFRNWPLEKIKEARLEDALKHPNWSMGQKITIDSATMVNKLFEVLEAFWLFGLKDIDALIEEHSLVHAIVEFIDGSTTFHLSQADMQLPIAYALLKRIDREVIQPLNLFDLHIAFKPIEIERYPVWQIKEELLTKPERGVVINAANEVAIERFIKQELSFLDISRIIIDAFEKFDIEVESVEDIYHIDKEVREYAKRC